MKTIGEKIAELRKELNVQQDEFADKIGVSRQTLSQWETGKQIPRADKIHEICIRFGVEANYFYEGLTEPKSAETREGETNERVEETTVPCPQEDAKTTNKKEKFTLENIYGVWKLIRGWLFALLLAAAVLGAFIVQISPNVNGTTVRVWVVDFTALTVILFFIAAIAVAAQVVHTVLYISKRRGRNDEKK